MSTSKQSRDHICKKIVDAEVENSPATFQGKNAAAVLLGQLGGQKGGKARAAKLSAERRREIALAANQARWNKKADSA